MIHGKAKEEFEKWLWNYANQKEKQNVSVTTFFDWFYNCDAIIRNSYYVEWFDSIEYYILINMDFDGFNYELDVFDSINPSGDGFETRTEATTKAIEKASDIFNNLKQ